MINLLSLIPPELIVIISNHTDPNTKKNLSLVERRTMAIVLDEVKSTRVFPPRGLSDNHSAGYYKDILVRIIRQRQNLKKVVFGPTKEWRKGRAFGSKQELYLRILISYFEKNHHEIPLGTLKKIKFTEIASDTPNEIDKNKASELNTIFLRSIGYRSLEKIEIQAYHIRSILTEAEIQPILEKSPKLKTFVFNGSLTNQVVNLSFVKQPQLSKIKLLDWRGSSYTIESLIGCRELKELVIDYKGDSPDEIIAVLLRDHFWNLECLELKGIIPNNDNELDEITKRLPNLKCLTIQMQNISDGGMERFGLNCPNLKILQLINNNLTDFGLHDLTQCLPNLEMISFADAKDITEEGIAALARNCKNLRFVRIVHCQRIGITAMNAFIGCCPNLTAIDFKYIEHVSFEGMCHIVEHFPKLSFIGLHSIGGVQKEEFKEFYRIFPHIKRIPSNLSLRKLYDLIMQ